MNLATTIEVNERIFLTSLLPQGSAD